MKTKLLVSSVLVVLLASLAISGIALAQKPTPAAPYAGPYGPGSRGAGGSGIMHEYLEDALADALGISTEELEDRRAAGETAWTIAQSKGISFEEFKALMAEARSKALDAMVADGVITQEHADWLKTRMNTMMRNGFGAGAGSNAGTCPMNNAFGGGRRGPGGRWNQTP